MTEQTQWVGAQFIAPDSTDQGTINQGAMNQGAINQGAINQGAINRAPTDLPHRRSIRLQGYDYSQAGAYFVTVCTHNRTCCFGEIVDGHMRLNSLGELVLATWLDLPGRFVQVSLDAFVVMPNHIHGILHITPVGAQFIAPDSTEQGAMNQGAINRAPTLGAVVRVLKAVSTRQIRLAGHGAFAWQRNYYEHIIRNEDSLARIREYIENNPLQWALDRENPANAESRGHA